MENIAYQPVQLNQRTVIVDVLRGWALLGVVLMNYLDFFTLGIDWSKFKPDVLSNILFYIGDLFFSAKSWTLLSVLFGYGFAVLMNNVKGKGHNPYGFFAGRMFWLLVLALINSALFFGDILKDYAILGLVMLLFYKASARTTFIASIILLLAIPAVDAYVSSLGDTLKDFLKLLPLYKSHNLFDVLWFGLKGTYIEEILYRPYLYTVHVVMLFCMLTGFTLYKINFFVNIGNNNKYVKRAFWISLGVAIAVIGCMFLTSKFTFMEHYSIRYFFVLSMMFFIGSAICWLYNAGKLKTFFANLSVMGKMTLTNYMVQNLIGLLIFSGFGLGVFNTKPLWFYYLMALVVYIIQIYFSKWWLARYNYGPIEWVWRQLSYRKRLPLKK